MPIDRSKKLSMGSVLGKIIVYNENGQKISAWSGMECVLSRESGKGPCLIVRHSRHKRGQGVFFRLAKLNKVVANGVPDGKLTVMIAHERVQCQIFISTTEDHDALTLMAKQLQHAERWAELEQNVTKEKTGLRDVDEEGLQRQQDQLAGLPTTQQQQQADEYADGIELAGEEEEDYDAAFELARAAEQAEEEERATNYYDTLDAAIAGRDEHAIANTFKDDVLRGGVDASQAVSSSSSSDDEDEATRKSQRKAKKEEKRKRKEEKKRAKAEKKAQRKERKLAHEARVSQYSAPELKQEPRDDHVMATAGGVSPLAEPGLSELYTTIAQGADPTAYDPEAEAEGGSDTLGLGTVPGSMLGLGSVGTYADVVGTTFGDVVPQAQQQFLPSSDTLHPNEIEIQPPQPQPQPQQEQPTQIALELDERSRRIEAFMDQLGVQPYQTDVIAKIEARVDREMKAALLSDTTTANPPLPAPAVAPETTTATATPSVLAEVSSNVAPTSMSALKQETSASAEGTTNASSAPLAPAASQEVPRKRPRMFVDEDEN